MKRSDVIFCGCMIAGFIVFGFWMGGFDGIINVFAAMFETVFKVILCIILFTVICFIFPKSWFSKLFSKKLIGSDLSKESEQKHEET